MMTPCCSNVPLNQGRSPWRSLLVLLVVACLAAPFMLPAATFAKDVYVSIDVPFPPGQRSMTDLFVGSDGKLYGVSRDDAGVGRLFQVDTKNRSVSWVAGLPKTMTPAAPLLAGDAAAWTWAPDWQSAYWLSRDGKLNVTLHDGSTESVGQVAGTRPFETDDPSSEGGMGWQVSQAIVISRAGDVYTAGDKGFIFRYSPGEKKLTRLASQLPAIPGRQAWATLDAAIAAEDFIYGATFDGYLFRFDTKSGAVTNYGKPIRQQRIGGIAMSGGRIVGFGGEPMGVHRGFALDLFGGGFDLTFPLTPGLSPVKALVATPAGEVYVGLGGRLGGLIQYTP